MKSSESIDPHPEQPDDHQYLQEAERRHQAEKALAVSEARYRAMLDGLDDGYFEVDLAGNFTVTNAALDTILGVAPASLVGRNNRRFTSPETAKAVQRIFQRMLRNGNRTRITDYEVLPQDGVPRTLELSVSLMRDEHNQPVGFRGLARDVSDQKHASDRQQQRNAQYQQVQKMEAIETLAGEMALDFNNLLMSIQANAFLMGMKMDKEGPLRVNLERINQSVDQGINLAKQLLSFAKVGKFVVRPTDLNAVIRRSASMFVRNRRQLQLNTYLKKQLWKADVDRVQIGQALLALFMRAADDMPEGGEMSISTDNVILDKADLEPYGLPAGAYIRISITDSGCGLDEASRRRIFEPFFSASGTGEQRDLGLAAVYGIVKSHAGLINVYSEKDQGATFNLYLPVSQKEGPEEPAVQESPAPRATVLLVDDDEALLQVAIRMLDRIGCHALTASNGTDALNLYAAHQSDIDLVIVDMIMPDMAPTDLLAGIRTRNARSVVLLSSGYSRNRRIDELLAMGFDDFIQKPFTSELLASTINDLHPQPAEPTADHDKE